MTDKPPLKKIPRNKRRRTKSQINRDAKLIAELYLKGNTQVEISEQLGFSQPTVSRAINELIAGWQAANHQAIDQIKAEQLAKINMLELEYWAAWERSKEATEIKQSKMVSGADPEKGPAKAERVVKEQSQIGDPRYLAGVQWCINRRIEILGLDAPKKIAPTTPDGGAIQSGVLIVMPSNGREAVIESDDGYDSE
jgi:predicted transcriptional regulator